MHDDLFTAHRLREFEWDTMTNVTNYADLSQISARKA